MTDEGSARDGRVGDQQAFAALLARLAADGGDEGDAAAHYERLRARLIALFRLHVPHEAEALADEALERLARRLSEGVVVAHLASYLHGIARLVLLEARSRPLQRRASDAELERLPAPDAIHDAEEEEFDPATRKALRACFAKLGTEASKLILAYYEFGADGMGDTGAGRIRRRQQLAERLGLSLNALRNRALRVREALEACVRARLAGDESSIPDTQGS